MSDLDNNLLNNQANNPTNKLASNLANNLIPLIDLTSLNPGDNKKIIQKLCEKANTAHGSVAAVCVLPKFIATAKKHLAGSDIKVATVSNFPNGDQDHSNYIKQIKTAIADGADEIDWVIPYQTLKTGNENAVLDALRAVRATCGDNITLKVILETGALDSIEQITNASKLAIIAGADFLKTSTGKIETGATLEAARAILVAIREFNPNKDKKIGIKISGGIRDVDTAQQYIELTEELMGKNWISPETFRIGTSQLLDDIQSK